MSRRRLAAPTLALGSGVATALALFAWSERSLSLHAGEVVSIATLAVGGGALCVLLQHLVLSAARRRGVALSASRRVALAVAVVDLPFYAALLVAERRGGAFAPGEAAMWSVMFAVVGTVYAALAD